jgi:hypothetical protein
MRLWWAWAVSVCVMALSGPAHAQIAGDEFGIERFRLTTDRHGVLGVDSAYVGEHLEYGAGISIGFAHDPLVIYDNTMAAVDPLVERRLSTDLVGSLTLWDKLQLGAGATVVGYQSGTGGLTLESLPKGGLGDFRFAPKVQLGARGDVFFAAMATLTVPGGAAGGWLREAGATLAPAFVMSGSRDRLRGDLNVGYMLRPKTQVAGLVSDDEAFARIAAGYQIVRRTEAFWSTSLAMPVVDVSRNQIALEMFAGVSQLVTSGTKMAPATSMMNVSVFAAAGVGLDNGYGTPDWRALAGVSVARMNIPPPPPPTKFGPDTDEPRVHVDVPVVVPKAKLTGTVTSSTGQPIPNAAVAIGSMEFTTDDNGHFAAELDGGAMTVDAVADGYEPGKTHITIAAGATGDVTVTLQRKVRQGQLRGQVLSFAGKPVPGASVTVGDKSTTTDADGNYSIDLPAGAFEVTIEAAGFATQKRKVNVKLDAVTVLNADMRAGK